MIAIIVNIENSDLDHKLQLATNSFQCNDIGLVLLFQTPAHFRLLLSILEFFCLHAFVTIPISPFFNSENLVMYVKAHSCEKWRIMIANFSLLLTRLTWLTRKKGQSNCKFLWWITQLNKALGKIAPSLTTGHHTPPFYHSQILKII